VSQIQRKLPRRLAAEFTIIVLGVLVCHPINLAIFNTQVT